MGHYYAEMCCSTCGKIPCKCPKDPSWTDVPRKTSQQEARDIQRIMKLFEKEHKEKINKRSKELIKQEKEQQKLQKEKENLKKSIDYFKYIKTTDTWNYEIGANKELNTLLKAAKERLKQYE